MSINRAQLVELAADELNLSSVGQTLAVEDSEKIDARIDPLIDNLAVRGVIYLGSTEDFADSISEPLSILLADSCAKIFGKPRDPVTRDRIEEELRVIARRAPATNKYLGTDPAMQSTGPYSYNRWLRGT